MLNHIVVMGRLTRDPELRYTQSQLPVTSFTVAVDRDFGGRDGGEKQTDFIDCVAWRNTAEFVSKYFTKGSMAVVSGRLQIRDWTDREGGKRRSAEIVADNVYFGESKRSRDEGGYAARPAGGNDGYRGGNDSFRAGGSDNFRGNGGGDSYRGGGNSSYQSFHNASAGSGFSELSDTDGELPF